MLSQYVLALYISIYYYNTSYFLSCSCPPAWQAIVTLLPDPATACHKAREKKPVKCRYIWLYVIDTSMPW